MELLELRSSRYCVVEMRFQFPALQEAVRHLRQVDPNNSIGIPEIRDKAFDTKLKTNRKCRY